MKFLVDAHLPRGRGATLADRRHDAVHTQDLAAGNATRDRVINQTLYAPLPSKKLMVESAIPELAARLEAGRERVSEAPGSKIPGTSAWVPALNHPGHLPTPSAAVRCRPHRATATARCVLGLFALLLAAGCRDRRADETLLPGYLEADMLEMGAPEGGYLTELAVRRGDQVAADAVLFKLDATPLALARQRAEASGDAARLRAEDALLGEREETIRRLEALVAAEEARLAQARAEFDRHTTLVRSGAVSQSAVQEREALYKQSRENLAALHAQLDLARKGQRPLQIAALDAEQRASQAARDLAAWLTAQAVRTSPEPAIVQDTLFEPGEWVPAGRPVVVLRRTRDLRARFFVPPAELAQLRLGDEIEIVLPGSATPLRAPVARISNQAEFTPPVIYSREESQRLVFLVEAQLPPAAAAELHPGLPVSIRLRPAGLTP
jgi:HlyD family secretion protein